MKADIGEIAALFHIAKAAHEHGDAFKHIRDAALSKLHEINSDHDPKAVDSSTDEEPAVEEQQPAESEPEQVDTNGAIETQRRV